MLKIDHPQVYLYSYQLSRESKIDDNSIWIWARKIWQHFSIEPTLTFLPNNLNYPLSKAHKFSHSNKIDGSLKFCHLDDSEGVLARIGSPETDENLGVTTLKEFNPDHLMVPSSYADWLGQTILITYKLRSSIAPTPEQLREIADECVKDLLPEFPPFYRATQLLDTYIFEYSSLQSQLQIFVYQIDDRLEKKLGSIIQPLFELFYHRHKITKAFIESRKNYNLAHKLSIGIETIIEKLEANLAVKDNQYSRDIKENIEQLMHDSLHYQRTLQTLKNFDNTISIHVYSYQQKLAEISDRLQILPEELTTFNLFIEKTAPYFQRQIQGDLGYFKHGTDLINTAIASIRGIVEIEQAESDRQRQEADKKRDQELQERLRNNAIAEKKRDQKLQNTIQSVGVGVGVGVGIGGIIATSYPLIDKPWNLPSVQNPLLPPHPFVMAIISSFLLGGGLGRLAWYITRKRLEAFSANKQELKSSEEKRSNPEINNEN